MVVSPNNGTWLVKWYPPQINRPGFINPGLKLHGIKTKSVSFQFLIGKDDHLDMNIQSSKSHETSGIVTGFC